MEHPIKRLLLLLPYYLYSANLRHIDIWWALLAFKGNRWMVIRLLGLRQLAIWASVDDFDVYGTRLTRHKLSMIRFDDDVVFIVIRLEQRVGIVFEIMRVDVEWLHDKWLFFCRWERWVIRTGIDNCESGPGCGCISPLGWVCNSRKLNEVTALL